MKISKILTNTTKTIITILLLLIVCISMNNFYKMTLGFVANDYEGGLFHICIIVAYLLPFIAFVFYFYNYYVKRIGKVTNVIYSTFIIALSIFVLISTFINIDIYVSNHSLGVYGALPSMLGGFPYDGIITSVILILVQVYNLSLVFKPNHKFAYLKEKYYSLNYFKFNVLEYIIMCVFALLVCFFTGDAISGLMMLKNVVYEPRYLFVLLWLVIGTMGNLICYVFKFENRLQTRKNKLLYLSSIILVNVILVALFVVFEVSAPNYIALTSKALFPITFSISLPLEMIFVFVIQAVATFIAIIKMGLVLFKK